MSKYRMINTDFWSDPWVLDELDDRATYLFLYLISNARCNVIGVYEISTRVISWESKIDIHDLPALFEQLDGKVTHREGWIVLHNSLKHQNWRSPKIQKLVADLLTEIPKWAFLHLNVPEELSTNLLEVYGIDTVSGNMDMVSQKRKENRKKIERKENRNTNAAKPQDFDKKKYAAAVRADEEQAKRIQKARGRPAAEPVSLSEMYKTKVTRKVIES